MKTIFKTILYLLLLPFFFIFSCSNENNEPLPCNKEIILEEYTTLVEEVLSNVGSCKETRDVTQKILDFMSNNKGCLIEALTLNEHQKDLIENNFDKAIESLRNNLEDLNELIDNGSCK